MTFEPMTFEEGHKLLRKQPRNDLRGRQTSMNVYEAAKKISDLFEKKISKRLFLNPETGTKVSFKELPKEEHDRIGKRIVLNLKKKYPDLYRILKGT